MKKLSISKIYIKQIILQVSNLNLLFSFIPQDSSNFPNLAINFHNINLQFSRQSEKIFLNSSLFIQIYKTNNFPSFLT